MVTEIKKLEGFSLNLFFGKTGLSILQEGIKFEVQIILKDLQMGAFFQIEYKPEIFSMN